MIDITPKYTIIPLSESVFLEDDGLGATIGGLGGKLVTDVEESVNKTDNAINSDYDIVTDLINARLDTSAKTILGDFTFGPSGAIKMITDADNGLWISPTGFLGKKAGVTTFAVDINGNATFAGDISGSTGTFSGTLIAGSVHIPDESTANSFHTNASGDSWWGCNVADFASDNDNALAYILKTGVAKFQSATITGLVVGTNVGLGTAEDSAGVTTIVGNTVTTSYVNALSITAGSVSADDITAGTINASVITVSNLDASNITTGILTGRLVRTSSGSSRVEMNASTNSLGVYYNSNLWMEIKEGYTSYFYNGNARGYIQPLSGGGMRYQAQGSSAVSIDYVDTGTNVGYFAPSSGITLDLGTSSVPFDDLYVNDITAGGTYLEIRDTIDMNGNDIRDVDLLYTDEINMLAAPYKIAGSYTSLEFETSASSSGGMTITAGTNGITVNGPLKLNDLLKLDSRSSTPGAAASYTGYIYYDTTQTTLVFSNGSGWYKVSATAI